MDEPTSYTPSEAFGIAIETAKAVCRPETPVDPNNIIVRVYRRCLLELRENRPELFEDGADMELTVKTMEAMTLARWMREWVPEQQQPVFIAACLGQDIEILDYLAH